MFYNWKYLHNNKLCLHGNQQKCDSCLKLVYMHIDYNHWPYCHCLWRHFLLSSALLVVIQTDPKGSLWDVASQGEAVSVTSFLHEAALKIIQKYASHTKETVVSTMILSLCFKRTCERSEEPISTGKPKVPSAKIKYKVNFSKIK